MPSHFNWVHAAHGHVPEHAVEAGRTSEGEMLYVGRTFYNGAPCVGKVLVKGWKGRGFGFAKFAPDARCDPAQGNEREREDREYTRMHVSRLCSTGSQESRLSVRPVRRQGNMFEGVRSLGAILKTLSAIAFGDVTKVSKAQPSTARSLKKGLLVSAREKFCSIRR